MTPTAKQDEAALWRTWRDAAATPIVDAAVRCLYDQLDAAVRARGPTCWTSGKCCNFDAYGHRLFVTGLEIAWVLASVRGGAGLRGRGGDGMALPQLISSGACVYQVNKLCSIHAHRPMGCRVYFCQSGTQEWQQQLYETFLGKLRALHEAHALPYRYMEWRAGLASALA